MKTESIKGVQWLGAVILGLLALAALERWQPLTPRAAQALENPIESRMEMIAELKKVNERLDRLVAIFESGKVKVTVANAEEIRGSASKEPAAHGGEAQGHAEEPKIIIRRKADPAGGTPSP